MYPQTDKRIYNRAFLGVSTSVVNFRKVIQKKLAMGSSLPVIDPKQHRTSLTKDSKEQFLADYKRNYLPGTQETGKHINMYPSPSSLYKDCIIKTTLTAQF